MEEKNIEPVIKRVLTTEVKFIIGIAVFIVGVVAPYYQIKEDVALIKQNHYTHIEALQKEVDEQQDEINEMEKDIVEMKKTEVQLMQTISDRLPKK